MALAQRLNQLHVQITDVNNIIESTGNALMLFIKKDLLAMFNVHFWNMMSLNEFTEPLFNTGYVRTLETVLNNIKVYAENLSHQAKKKY